jgi:hypothetical protein
MEDVVAKKQFVFIALVALLAGAASIQTETQGQTDVRALLQAVSKNIGADNLTTLEYTGSGMVAAPGQGFDPIPVLIGVPESWPRFAVTNYTMTIDYTTMSSRESYTRTSPEWPVQFPGLGVSGSQHGNLSDPPFRRGGGGIANPAPLQIDLRVNKNVAWDLVDNKPVRQWEYLFGIDAAEYRQLEIILTPHGFVKAALAPGANPILVPGGGPRRVVLNNVLGKYKVVGTLEENLVRMVETWIPNPVVGDMRINHEYVEWKDFGGIKFWTEDHSHFVEGYQADNRQFRIVNARANVKVVPETFAVPQDAQQATRPAVRVESTRLADGVWLLGGGSHNSVLMDFRNFVAVVEAPQNDERAQAVVAEVRRLVPNKPIRYVVNTHYHWDHSGGLRGLVAAGAQVVTHDGNVDYYNRVMFGTPRRLMPDSLSQREELLGTIIRPQYLRITNQPGMIHDREWGTPTTGRIMEFYSVGTGSPPFSSHNEFFLAVYLPAERILINADLYTPPAAGTQPPATPPEGVVALGHIIRENKLNVAQHVPIHGQPGSHEQFLKILGGRVVPDAHGPLVLPTTTTSQ